MNRFVAVLLLGAASLASQTAAVADDPGNPTSPAPSEPVTVLLASGRAFVAEIDGRTDESDLWLSWRRGGISLLRPICWEQVAHVAMAGQTFSGDAARRAVVALRQNAVDVGEKKDEATAPAEALLIGPSPENVTLVQHAAEPHPRPALVKSLSIDADADNSDSDADVDGLVVTISPRDDQGQLLPVSGTLEVRLLGPRPHGREGGVPLARWTQRVLPSDFDVAGATYRLRFPRGGPRFGREAYPHADVDARLVVPGNGVFEAIAPMVRIWPYRAVNQWRRW